MNAIELYEVVKDVPREAWPHGPSRPMFYCEVRGFYHDCGMVCPLVVSWEAVMLFEASVMRWLLSKAIIVHVYYSHQDGRTSLTLNGSGINGTLHIDKPSLVEALAAACKAVAS